jgi:hypothetical protein
MRVPTLEGGGTQIQNLPNARLEAHDLGTQAIARGLQDVAQVAQQIGHRERAKARAAKLLEADRKLQQWEIDRLYKPETGLLNRKGKNALGVPDEALPEFDKLASEIEGGLHGDEEAMTTFRARANARRGDVQMQLYRHVSSESEGILKAEAAAHEATALQNIAVHAGDPQRVQMEVERLWASKASMLDEQGASPEVVKAARQEMMVNVHGGVLDQFMARGEYARAVEYFKANRVELGAKADEYGAQVKQAELQIQETAESDRILAAFGTGSGALREAAKIEDPFLRERVEARIDREGARRERLQNEYERNVREHLLQQLETTGKLPTDPRQRAAAMSQPGLWRDMELRARQIEEGVEPVRDDKRYYDLVDEAAANPAAFAKRDLNLERTRMDDASWNQLIATQASIKRGGAADDPLKTMQATNAIATQTLGLAGLDPSPERNNQKAEAERVTKMRKALDDQVRLYRQQNGGKEPPTTEIQRMADELMMPWKRTVEDGGWFAFDSEESGFAFEAPPAPAEAASRQDGQIYLTPSGPMKWRAADQRWYPTRPR